MTDRYEGGTVMFFCDEGYALTGVSEVECLSSGQWSSTWPTCTRGKWKTRTPEHLVLM